MLKRGIRGALERFTVGWIALGLVVMLSAALGGVGASEAFDYFWPTKNEPYPDLAWQCAVVGPSALRLYALYEGMDGRDGW